ncbi:uncharacterized protein LOC141534920 isoform X2 [Cotesia typhae]|uniref:uncharacterized protein LOC141534920 isoform X2 n=1 Tax=Cotesia typhae TaxID=2053667 RepID=UPI003D68ABAB
MVDRHRGCSKTITQNTESPTITTTAATTSSTTSTTTTTEFTSSVTDSSNEQVKSSTYQDSSNGEASSDQSHIIDVPTVINEDFDYILSKLDINFSSSRNKEELENKITRIKKLVQLYDSNSDELKIQSEDNCTSASLSTIGSLSIHLSRARGRAKGKKNRFLGQPTNELNDNPNSFELLSEPQKKIFTLKLILSDEDKVLRIIKYKIKISIENLKHLSLKSIPDALASDSIEIKIIKEYFERDAFVYLDELIISKKRSDYWTCKICKMELSTSDSVECDKCLFWSHFSCVGLVQEPESYWSCPKGC